MNYADYKRFDVLNGEGIRHSLFVQGCRNYCKGCFNTTSWNFKGGKPFTKEIEDMIIDDLKIDYVEISGLSLLGGEPFQNTDGLIPLVKRVRSECPNRTIWAWSGLTFEEICSNEDSFELLKHVDVLIDGRFVLEERDLTLRWAGSRNQRVIDVQESLKQGSVTLYTN